MNARPLFGALAGLVLAGTFGCSSAKPPPASLECELDEDCTEGTVCDPFTARCVSGDQLPPRAHLGFDIRERSAGTTLFRAEVLGCDLEVRPSDLGFSALSIERLDVLPGSSVVRAQHQQPHRSRRPPGRRDDHRGDRAFAGRTRGPAAQSHRAPGRPGIPRRRDAGAGSRPLAPVPHVRPAAATEPRRLDRPPGLAGPAAGRGRTRAAAPFARARVPDGRGPRHLRARRRRRRGAAAVHARHRLLR